MLCPKCSGLMVREDYHGAVRCSYDEYHAFRCIICGEIIDNVIIINRQIQAVFQERKR